MNAVRTTLFAGLLAVLIALGATTHPAAAAAAQASAHWTKCVIHLNWPDAHRVTAKQCYKIAMPRESRAPIGHVLIQDYRQSAHVQIRVWWPRFETVLPILPAGSLPGCPAAIGQWAGSIIQASRTYGIPVPVLTGIMAMESGGNPYAYNASSGASGLMQLLSMNFYLLHGASPFNGPANIDAGAHLLALFGGNLSSYSGGGYSSAWGCD